MTRVLALLLTLLLLVVPALADESIDLTKMTDHELLALIAEAQQELARGEDRRIKQAIEILKADCIERNEVFLQDDGTYTADGYLEILHTQVIYIQDEIHMEDDDPETAKYLQTKAEEFFGDVACIVEFVIMVDWGYGFQPASFSPVCFNYSVIFQKDGGSFSQYLGYFHLYRSRTYSVDFTHIIESISDRNYEFNNTWYLLK